MKLLQNILTNIIAMASGCITASIWISENNNYIKVLPIIFLALAIKAALYDFNNK